MLENGKAVRLRSPVLSARPRLAGNSLCGFRLIAYCVYSYRERLLLKSNETKTIGQETFEIFRNLISWCVACPRVVLPRTKTIHFRYPKIHCGVRDARRRRRMTALLERAPRNWQSDRLRSNPNGRPLERPCDVNAGRRRQRRAKKGSHREPVVLE